MLRKLVFLALLAAVAANVSAYSKKTEMVPMRDGVKLATDIYRPWLQLGKQPTIFTRTPYDRAIPWIYAFYICDVKRCVLVSQSLRGTGGSQGQPTFFQTDGWGTLQDGYDAIEWIASRSWSNKKVGMWGASAFAMTQYLAAGAAPPHLTCGVPMIGATSLYHHSAFQGGEFRKQLVENWLDTVATPWFKDTVANHPNYTTSFWGLLDLSQRYAQAKYPMYHMGGWYDLYTDAYLDAFSALQARFHNQKLLIGPWGHGGMWGSVTQGDLTYPDNAAADTTFFLTQMLDWYDYWLRGKSNGIMTRPRVVYYLMGDVTTSDTTRWNRWISTDTWPVRNVSYQRWYLHQGGLLDLSVPAASEKPDTFRYDPKNPCPTIGGREYMGSPGNYGPKDQRPIESRPDVLVFTSAALSSPVKVVGKMKLVLFGSSNRLDTDWAVRVSDVYPDGRSILVTDGILMARHRHGFDREDLLTPGVADTFEVDLWSTALVFNQGHRIRVSVTSSNYPRFERNPNSGGPFRRNDTLATLIATNVVQHKAAMPSYLYLPVAPLDDAGGVMAETFELPRIGDDYLHVASPSSRPELWLALPGPAQAEVTIVDVSGRVVERVFAGVAGAGVTQLRPRSVLPAGVYYVRLKTAEDLGVRKLVVTR